VNIWLFALDLGLFALIAYYVYVSIRNTQAIQLIKGILVLFALNMFVQYLGLMIVGRILDGVITALTVAIPVIFQPELRRALRRLGGNPRLLEPAGGSTSDVASVVAEAAGRLSNLGWGALMVIEMEVGLEQYIASGVSLNAKPSTHLLETIFMPGTALHDGAVIIEGGRIAAAGCFLPLTQDIADRSLGSRHRAALGLSEVSDAVVVVVSEERGSISVAIEGVLHRGLAPDQVKAMILARYSRRKRIADGGFIERTKTKVLEWFGAGD
jgi:diadenylate cyclase